MKIKLLLFFALFSGILSSQTFEWAHITPVNISTNPFYLTSVLSVDNTGNPVHSILLNSKYIYSQSYFGDVELIKRNSDGVITWSDTVLGKIDMSRIMVDQQNNIIYAGTFKDSIIVDENNFLFSTSSSPVSFIFKKDENGNTIWLKNLDQHFQNFYTISSAAIDNAGSIWVTAYNFSNSTIYKFDINGNLVSSIEQTNVRQADDLSIDSDGNIWVTGAANGFITQSFNGLDTIPPSLYNEYVVKYSPDGTPQWVVFIEDITFQSFRIVTDDSGNAYLAGNLNLSTWFGNILANGPHWVYSYFLTKIDPNGNFLWLRETPASVPAGDGSVGSSNFLHYNNYGYVYVTGFMRNHLDYGNAVVLNSFGSYDVLVFKYTANGELKWALNAGSIWIDEGSSVASDADGNCYLVGRVSENATFGNINLGGGSLNQFITKITDEDVVPVELTSFTATVNGNSVHLNWSTAAEMNNMGFEIEKRASSKSPLPTGQAGPKGETSGWGRIGFVDGYGTTTKSQYYSFIDNNLEVGKYQYRLKQIDFDGTFEFSNVIEVEIGIPEKFALFQNYPNPFNPSTKIKISIPYVGTRLALSVSLKVYDILGNEVATLVDEYKPSGSYEVEFNAYQLSSGIYFYRMQADNPSAGSGRGFVEAKKMILLR